MSSSTPPLPHDSHDSLHLTAADFDAYVPERAASSEVTSLRLAVKERMLAWARVVVSRLDELEIEVEASASDDQPTARNVRRVDCQRVFFRRDGAARAELERLLDRKRTLAESLGDPSPHKHHAYLALRLDGDGVEVSIELHAEASVDTRNLRARVADPGRALELAAALEALPDQFAIGLGTDAARPQAQRATNDEVRVLLDRVDAEKAPLWIGWSVPKDVVLAHADVLDEQLEDAIVALGPLYKLIVWAPDNDLVVVDREWDDARADRALALEEAERRRAERKSRREGERRARAPRDTERERRDERTDAAPPSADREPERTPAPARVSDAPREIAPLPRRPIVRAARVTEVDPSAPIEKGARVQVLGGPFEGKIGVVQELDGQGGARVMLGLLAMRFEVTDLMVSAEGRDRPLLSSSHRRRPIPARS